LLSKDSKTVLPINYDSDHHKELDLPSLDDFMTFFNIAFHAKEENERVLTKIWHIDLHVFVCTDFT